jgi:hypothetical protein
MNTISYEDLKVGDWIRFYTNSLRGPGAVTRLAQITGFKYCRATKRLGIQRHRIGLTAVNAVDAFDDVGEIIEVNPPITKGISFL